MLVLVRYFLCILPVYSGAPYTFYKIFITYQKNNSLPHQSRTPKHFKVKTPDHTKTINQKSERHSAHHRRNVIAPSLGAAAHGVV
jgi:hypothetical protein